MKLEFLPAACLCSVLVLSTSALTAADAPASLADQLPRIPAHEPTDANSTFKLQRGFSLELVASEPDVVDPIDAAFDEDGRMYVVEMRDYPFLPEQRPEKYVKRQPERFGSVRLLEDTDGDGKMDRSTVFADKLTWPQSVCCYNGGVFVIAPPALWYLKDTNGDGVADQREDVLKGFGVSNVQGLSNGLEWSFDHGIYWAGGRSGAAIEQNGMPLFTLNRQDLRLDPRARSVTAVSGGEQYGHTFDDWGNRYVCNNSNHLEQVVLPARYLDRNPQLSVSNAVRTIAEEGAAAPVFRISPPEPWRVVRTARRAADPKFAASASKTELVVTGFFTSATGVTVYRGGAYPEEYRGNVFIGDVGGNLVHRKALESNGLTMIGRRTEKDVEFLASTDNWFRPTNFVNAPDGSLYVLDMYWETIEHPASIPEDIKEHLDLESGNDRGRIYRLVSPEMTRFKPPKMSGMTAAELAAQLESPHGWVRETAHRLLWERQDTSCVPALQQLVKTGSTPQSRLLALWSLQGLKQLTPADVIAGLKDAHPRVREQAVRLSEEFTAMPEAVLPQIAALATDPDPRVRWQLAFSLGEFRDPRAANVLLELAKSSAKDNDMRIAILSSIPQIAGDFAKLLLADSQTAGSPLVTDTIAAIASGDNVAETQKVFAAVLEAPLSTDIRNRHLTALGQGLRRRGATLDGLATANDVSPALQQQYAGWLEQTLATVAATDAALPTRLSALDVLSTVGRADIRTTVAPLLEPLAPPTLQDRAVQLLASSGDAASLELLLEKWKGLGPQARRSGIDRLTQSAAGANLLLTGLEQQVIRPIELDRDKQQLLLTYPDAETKARAAKIVSTVGSNRKAVVTELQSALSLSGDAVRGKAVYGKICIQCHRAGNEGYLVGPDLASVQNKSPDDLLIAILDPNREAQPVFTTYTALTVNGQVATGIVAAESAASITLRRAEAKEDTVLRDQLEELLSNGVSLMPEGLEKDLTPQQIADVIAFIKGQAPAGK